MHADLPAGAPPTPAGSRDGGYAERELSVRSYFRAFAPAADWDDLVRWPPDVFALANLVLDHTEAYRFVVAPPAGRRWPPAPDWNRRIQDAARAWRAVAAPAAGALPGLVDRCWASITRHRDAPLASVRSGDAWELTEALLTLHAVADEACAALGRPRRQPSAPSFEDRAWALLGARATLSRLSPTRVRIVPKTRFSPRGITIRSLSRHLALCYESVDVRWRSAEPGSGAVDGEFRLVLVPWPYLVDACDFHPAPGAPVHGMDVERFGYFEFTPDQSAGPTALGLLLARVLDEAGHVDAVVLPESAVRPEEIPVLERVVDQHGASFLVAGVRQAATTAGFGRNYLHFGVRTATGWERFEQDKHHRWCLDRQQIRQYHLTRSLDPAKLWWEAIDIRERILHIVDVGAGVTAAPLVCEDLARLDEVADLVRRIGPSLVVALLLDGPQLSGRWPSRYAGVLADEPGSAVLTLTSFGMAVRSRPPGRPTSRVIAHWSSGANERREIPLAPRAAAVLLSASVERETCWTADGRSHHDVPGLALSGVEQLCGRGRRRRS